MFVVFSVPISCLGYNSQPLNTYDLLEKYLGMPGIEPGPETCKSRTLSTVVFFFLWKMDMQNFLGLFGRNKVKVSENMNPGFGKSLL